MTVGRIRFEDEHVHRRVGVSLHASSEVVTSRWPQVADPAGARLRFPTST